MFFKISSRLPHHCFMSQTQKGLLFFRITSRANHMNPFVSTFPTVALHDSCLFTDCNIIRYIEKYDFRKHFMVEGYSGLECLGKRFKRADHGNPYRSIGFSGVGDTVSGQSQEWKKDHSDVILSSNVNAPWTCRGSDPYPTRIFISVTADLFKFIAEKHTENKNIGKRTLVGCIKHVFFHFFPFL